MSQTYNGVWMVLFLTTLCAQENPYVNHPYHIKCPGSHTADVACYYLLRYHKCCIACLAKLNLFEIEKDYIRYEISNETDKAYSNGLILFDIWYKECTLNRYHATICVIHQKEAYIRIWLPDGIWIPSRYDMKKATTAHANGSHQFGFYVITRLRNWHYPRSMV